MRVLIVALGIIAGALAGCSLGGDRVDWTGTSWVVVSVAGVDIPTEERARLTFGVDRIEVALLCGTVIDTLVIEDTTQQADGFLGEDAVSSASGSVVTGCASSVLL